MGDFILITIAKYGHTQLSRYSSAVLVEQAWELARQEMRTEKSIWVVQYRIDVQGRLAPMRSTWSTDRRKTRAILRRLAAIRKEFQEPV